MPVEIAQIGQAVLIMALPAIFAITFHEAAHGYVAYKLGDDTAWKAGRVTFNPLRHIDLFGTIIMPLLLFVVSISSFGRPFIFGYAKPVPVRFDRLNHPRRDMIWVAAAGPATNVLLAIVSALLLYLVPYVPLFFRPWLDGNLETSIWFNVILAVFNMIPLPPLDGGRVAVGLLPDVLAIPLARSERYGMLVLILLLFLLPLAGMQFGMDLNIISHVIARPVDWLVNLIAWLTGVNA
jgi:Zn-dependent protease